MIYPYRRFTMKKVLCLSALLFTALLTNGCASTDGRAASLVSNIGDTYARMSTYFSEQWNATAESVSDFADTFQSNSPIVEASAASNVDRLLAKLRNSTDTELRDQDRQRQARQNQQIREQTSPDDPQNAVQKQNEDTKNRIANLEDKQKDNAEAAK